MPADHKTARNAFTLVEMLVVIVIIGILVGLTAAALGPARRAARNAAVNAEIKQLDMDLQNYRNEFGELPPTFIDVNIVVEQPSNPLGPTLQADARNAVIRHLRKAFPRYVPGQIRGRTGAFPPNTNPNPDGLPDNLDGTGGPYDGFANDVWYAYNRTIDPRLFDPASALVFWLGGLPEQVPAVGGQWIPAGFHSDPQMPFKPGTPRKQPLFEFKAERIVLEEMHYSIPWDNASPPTTRYLRYYPDKVEAPYVYFKARRRGANWQYGAELDAKPNPTYVPYAYFHSLVADNLDTMNICVAYRDPQSPPFWRNYDTYQIIAAGLDGQFGKTPPKDANGIAVYRVTKTAVNFSDDDRNNLANFCEAATLEDEIE
ncbi:MAG TPA: prepilin-type N-terminal cleavage/methylation domain-containing protein [Thermoguttaceae bacterium]|nr:prepilin-type N-terminal cleavage/methylation domain-containing protein [Thermoguttaceae bacterium]